MFQIVQLIPVPLKEQKIVSSEVWNTELEISSSDKVFLSAASGKGKTTFQMILYGIRKDYEGTVKFDGKDIRSYSLNQWSEIRQKRLSIVFQDLRLFPNLSAFENIDLKNRLCEGKSREEIWNMAERLSVAEFLDKKAGILSYGQRQRIAIIRALCQPFDLLLLDEPFSHLDTENIKKSCELIMEETQKRNSGFIISSLGDNYFLNYNRTIQL